MKEKFFVIMILLIISSKNMAQQQKAGNEVIRKIELDSFSNKMAFEMGSKIIELAGKRKQPIAVEIGRLSHTIFLYIDEGLSKDKLNWLRRKANVAKQFEESSLSVKHDLLEGNMSLVKTFALDEKDFLAKGGAIPIFVKGAGMVAVVTVSGLHDEEDHQIIIDALDGKYLKFSK